MFILQIHSLEKKIIPSSKTFRGFGLLATLRVCNLKTLNANPVSHFREGRKLDQRQQDRLSLQTLIYTFSRNTIPQKFLPPPGIYKTLMWNIC